MSRGQLRQRFAEGKPVPADAPVPAAEVREYLNANLPAMARSCSSYHVNMEGAGFVTALKRGVLTLS